MRAGVRKVSIRPSGAIDWLCRRLWAEATCIRGTWVIQRIYNCKRIAQSARGTRRAVALVVTEGLVPVSTNRARNHDVAARAVVPKSAFSRCWISLFAFASRRAVTAPCWRRESDNVAEGSIRAWDLNFRGVRTVEARGTESTVGHPRRGKGRSRGVWLPNASSTHKAAETLPSYETIRAVGCPGAAGALPRFP